MKKIGLLASLILLGNVLFAQGINEGKQFLNYERYQSAEDVFKKLVASDPNNVEAVYWLGQTYLANQDIVDTTSAKELYQKTLQANPNAPLIMVGIGQVELREGKTTDARNHFETAISLAKKKEKEDIQEAVGRANVLAKNGDILYGIAKLNEAAEKDKKNPEIYNLIGEGYWKLNDGSNAIINYQKAMAIDPKDARASWMIGRIYETQGYNQETIYMKHYLDAINEDPNFAPVYYWLYGYYYNRDVNTAADYLNKYIAVADNNSKNCYAKASLMYVSKKYPETVSQADACITEAGAKAYPNLYGLKAYAYDKMGDSLKAKEAFEQFFSKVNPDNIGPKDYATYGKVLLQFPGQEELAETNINKALALDTVVKNKVDFLKDIAKGFADKKNYAEAGKWYGRVLAVDSAFGKTDLFYAGYNDYRGDNYKTSDSIFQIYQQKYPDDPLGWYMGGHAQEGIDTSGALGLARPSYQKVIDIADTMQDKSTVKDKLIPSYRYMVAYYYNIKGQADTALMYNNKILEVDPADATALKTKDALESVIKNRAKAGAANKPSDSTKPK